MSYAIIWTCRWDSAAAIDACQSARSKTCRALDAERARLMRSRRRIGAFNSAG